MTWKEGQTPEELLEYFQRIGLRKTSKKNDQSKVPPKKKGKNDNLFRKNQIKRCDICKNVYSGEGELCDQCRKVDRTVSRYGIGDFGQGRSGGKGITPMNFGFGPTYKPPMCEKCESPALNHHKLCKTCLRKK